jgi:hypothetical protein
MSFTGIAPDVLRDLFRVGSEMGGDDDCQD